MTSIDDAKAAVEAARVDAVEAQKAFLESLGEEWQNLASQKFRRLAIELQPETTQAHGDHFAEVKATVARVITEGRERVVELFADISDPEKLVSQVQDRTYGDGPISIKVNRYPSPVETLTQPLHEALARYNYNPDLVKSRTPQSNYSSSGFTESDFPVVSGTIQSTYAKSINAYGKARFALAALEKESATNAAQNLWDRA